MHYINAEKQKEMVRLINEFYILTEDGKLKTKESDRIMNLLFKECDKIIFGIIRSPMYQFFRWADEDELASEARWHLYQSILKKQWDPAKGASIFSFFSTVVSNNLKSYTKKLRKKSNRFSNHEIQDVHSDPAIFWKVDFDNIFVNTYLFDEIERFFEENEKDKFLSLAKVFRQYFLENKHVKFKKKDFISFAASYGYSQSFCNTFFDHLKKIKNLRTIWQDLYKDNFNSNKKVHYKNYIENYETNYSGK